MSKHTYTAVFFDAEEGGYFVDVPALPGCLTEGGSFTEALLTVEEAITLHLETLTDRGESIPVEDDELLVHMDDERQALLRKVTVTLEEAG